MGNISAPFDRTCVSDARDTAIGADEDRRVIDHLAGQYVEHAGTGDDGALCRRILCLRRRDWQRERQKRCP